MNEVTTSTEARLLQLERYLSEDPANAALLADACDEAVAAGLLDRAVLHLRAAESLGLDDVRWIGRSARVALASGEWADALARLERLVATAGPHPAISHDIAFARFHAGDFDACRAELDPWLRMPQDADLLADTAGPLQRLWLRASHHLGLLEEARDWARDELSRHALLPAAAGVAALIAVDLGDFLFARQVLQSAAGAYPPSAEALLAGASIAIAERRPQTAITLLHQALELDPREGRTWSTFGMANLQLRELPQARLQFSRASTLMPRHIGTWHGLGWACLLLRDLPAALVAFQQALALDPTFAESHGAVGLALWLSGRQHEAEPHLARADRLDRRNVTGRYARALAAGMLQDGDAVRALAVRLLDRPGVFRPRLSDEVDM
jgi:Flp pilus assembly protein TadD